MCCHAFDFPVPRWSLVKMCRGVFIGLRELQAGTDDGRGRRGQGGRGHASVQLLLRDLIRRQPGPPAQDLRQLRRRRVGPEAAGRRRLRRGGGCIHG